MFSGCSNSAASNSSSAAFRSFSRGQPRQAASARQDGVGLPLRLASNASLEPARSPFFFLGSTFIEGRRRVVWPQLTRQSRVERCLLGSLPPAIPVVLAGRAPCPTWDPDPPLSQERHEPLLIVHLPTRSSLCAGGFAPRVLSFGSGSSDRSVKLDELAASARVKYPKGFQFVQRCSAELPRRESKVDSGYANPSAWRETSAHLDPTARSCLLLPAARGEGRTTPDGALR